MRTLIRELRDRHSVILSTHILPEVEAVCDRVEIMHLGAIVYSDTIEALRRFRGGQALRVGLRRTPPLEQLAQLPGRGERRSCRRFRACVVRRRARSSRRDRARQRGARLGSALSRSRRRQSGGRVRAVDDGGAPGVILTIAGKELRRLFTSPLAWVILAFLQLILAWIFLSRLQTFIELQPQIAMTPDRAGIYRDRGGAHLRHRNDRAAHGGSAALDAAHRRGAAQPDSAISALGAGIDYARSCWESFSACWDSCRWQWGCWY